MAEHQRRRRRVRTPDSAPAPAEPPPVPDPAPVAQTSPVHEEPWAGAAAYAEAPVSERGLRGLVGGGSSQVSPTVALRARDAARPRPEDIDRAERELTIVRRNWAPRD
jgi:hypothetical protein